MSVKRSKQAFLGTTSLIRSKLLVCSRLVIAFGKEACLNPPFLPSICLV